MLGFPAGLFEWGIDGASCSSWTRTSCLVPVCLEGEKKKKTCQTCLLRFALYARACVCGLLTSPNGGKHPNVHQNSRTKMEIRPSWFFCVVWQVCFWKSAESAGGGCLCFQVWLRAQQQIENTDKEHVATWSQRYKLPSSIYLWLILGLLDPSHIKKTCSNVFVWFSSCCFQGMITPAAVRDFKKRGKKQQQINSVQSKTDNLRCPLLLIGGFNVWWINCSAPLYGHMMTIHISCYCANVNRVYICRNKRPT